MGHQPTLRGERAAGAILLRGGPLAGFVVLLTCLAAAGSVPFGLWGWPALVLLPVGAWAARRLLRLVPTRPVPVWTAVASVAVSAAFGGWAWVTHAEHVLIRRDAGSYALYAQWIGSRHGLPVDARLAAFGGSAALAVKGFDVASPAFFQVGMPGGVEIVPQFLLGAPALFSLGWWAGGWSGTFAVPPLLGAASLLAMAGLTARLVGPRWAPLAAAVLGLTAPVLHAARSTYSETPALLLVLVAAALAVDAVTLGNGAVGNGAVGNGAVGNGVGGGSGGDRPARDLALLAGAVLGLAGLVRVDAVREVAMVLPVCAVLALRRNPAGSALGVGAVLGAALAAVPAVLLAWPYLWMLRGSLFPLVIATVLLAGLSSVAVLIPRVLGPRTRGRDGRAAGGRRVGPALAAGAVLALGLLLASRPWWSAGHTPADDNPAVDFVEALQRRQGLPVDGTATYAQDSLTWVVWYVGPVAVLAFWLVLAELARRAARPADWGPRPAVPPWLVPGFVALTSTALTLYRPGITPDHPWADRRLVPVVLPAVTLAATAAAAWCVRRARRRAPAWLLVTSVAVSAGVLLVPAAAGTWPSVLDRTERGEPGAVAAVCAALRPTDVVVAVDGLADGGTGRSANEWPQVIRGVCRRPVASLHPPAAELAASVAALRPLIVAAGGRLVLLGAGDAPDPPALLRSLGGQPSPVVHLRTTEDLRLLTRPPRGVDRLLIDVWLAPLP